MLQSGFGGYSNTSVSQEFICQRKTPLERTSTFQTSLAEHDIQTHFQENTANSCNIFVIKCVPLMQVISILAIRITSTPYEKGPSLCAVCTDGMLIESENP